MLSVLPCELVAVPLHSPHPQSLIRQSFPGSIPRNGGWGFPSLNAPPLEEIGHFLRNGYQSVVLVHVMLTFGTCPMSSTSSHSLCSSAGTLVLIFRVLAQSSQKIFSCLGSFCFFNRGSPSAWPGGTLAFAILGIAFTWGLLVEPAAVGSDSSPISMMKPVDWGSPAALFAAAPRLEGGGVGGCLDVLAPSVTDLRLQKSTICIE